MTNSEHIRKTLEVILSQIDEDERNTAERKKAANELCRLLQEPMVFADVDAASALTTRADEYYGRQMPEVINAILEKRKHANLGAATVAEIHAAMAQGGFRFQTQNDAYAKRGIYGILANTPGFHKLPDGRYGLAAWYPAVRTKTEQQETTPKSARKKGRGHKKKTSATEATVTNGAPKLKKGSIAAIVATVLKDAPSGKMDIDLLKPEVVKRGIADKPELRTVIYNGLMRRDDIFAKVGKKHFQLKRHDFVIEE